MGKGKKKAKKKAKLLQSYNAWLTHLPAGWAWRYGPLLVHVEEWSDDNCCVDWPGVNLYGQGLWPSDAMEDFVVTLQEVHEILTERQVRGASMSEGTLRQMATMADVFVIPPAAPGVAAGHDHEDGRAGAGGASGDGVAREGLGDGAGGGPGEAEAARA